MWQRVATTSCSHLSPHLRTIHKRSWSWQMWHTTPAFCLTALKLRKQNTLGAEPSGTLLFSAWRSRSSSILKQALTQHIQPHGLSPTFTCMFPKRSAAHWRDGSVLVWTQCSGQTDGKRPQSWRLWKLCHNVSQRGSYQTFPSLYRAIYEMRTAVLLLLAGLSVSSITSALKICAFNVQSFGESKANNQKVMGILLKVVWLAGLQQVQPHPRRDEPLRNLLLSLLLLLQRYFLAVTWLSFRRSETQKEKQFRLWSTISTGTTPVISPETARSGSENNKSNSSFSCWSLQIWQIQYVLLRSEWEAG